MTTHARIIIIGGGIVGVSILYHLAKAGEADALLLERRDLTAGATWHAAGNVHTQSAYANLSSLQAYSLRLYDGLSEEVGQEVDSHVVGGFFLAQTKARMEEFKHLAGKFKGLDIAYDLVTPEEIKRKYPLLRVDDLEAVHGIRKRATSIPIPSRWGLRPAPESMAARSSSTRRSTALPGSLRAIGA